MKKKNTRRPFADRFSFESRSGSSIFIYYLLEFAKKREKTDKKIARKPQGRSDFRVRQTAVAVKRKKNVYETRVSLR